MTSTQWQEDAKCSATKVVPGNLLIDECARLSYMDPECTFNAFIWPKSDLVKAAATESGLGATSNPGWQTSRGVCKCCTGPLKFEESTEYDTFVASGAELAIQSKDVEFVVITVSPPIDSPCTSLRTNGASRCSTWKGMYDVRTYGHYNADRWQANVVTDSRQSPKELCIKGRFTMVNNQDCMAHGFTAIENKEECMYAGKMLGIGNGKWTDPATVKSHP